MLYAEQRLMLRDYFAGTTETLILLPKKAGKTTLMAALSLWHLLSTPDAECVIAAASRDQAAIMLRQARGFIRRSPALQERVAIKQREVVKFADEGRIRVLAADADTADGVLPTLALVDELHRHKSADLYGVFRDGLGPRNGKLITISTAGDDESSPLGVMRTAALDLPTVKSDGAYRFCRSADGHYVMHEWALNARDDRSDMAVVKRANPAPWQTIEALKRRHDSPSMTAWQWARFACGVWMDGEESWIDPEAWDACRGTVELEPGQDVFVGVDVGQKKDSTALAVAGWVGDKLHVTVKVMVPTGGQPNAAADARTAIGDLNDEYRLVEVPYDPWHFSESAEMLSDRGVPMVEFPQTDGRMAPASEALYELIRAGRLVHDGDAELRRQVMAAVPARTERGVKISKRKSKRRIDAAVALAMAAHRAVHGRSQSDLLVEVFS